MTYLRQRLSLNMIVLLFLIAVGIGTSGASLINNASGYDADWRSGWFQNFSTEVFGAIMTFGVFELLVGSRKEQKELKARLIREAGSKDNAIAVKAIREITERGWLKGDTGILTGVTLEGVNLEGADLGGVNLAGADLGGANLTGAKLGGAKLTGAKLWDANLAGASLVGANLDGVNLWGANLSGAYLRISNLSGANLGGANLAGANLWGANLAGAKLKGANYDDKTVLPDAQNSGTLLKPIYDKYWTPEIDMTRYTDPEHPDFWQPKKDD